MHVCYVTLSPSFGMHQSTAGLANLLIPLTGDSIAVPFDKITVLTTVGAPIDRYAPQIEVCPIVPVRGTGLQLTSLNARALSKVYQTIIKSKPDVVHFNSPHIWNPILLFLLRRAGIPTVQTIHDLDPHSGAGYGKLLYAWNDLVLRIASHILVHGQAYRTRLLDRGLPAKKVTFAPLVHLFLSYAVEQQLTLNRQVPMVSHTAVTTHDRLFALFFARIEAYKGVDTLVAAMRRIEHSAPRIASDSLGSTWLGAVIAGKGDIHRIVKETLPGNVELRNRLIEDEEAVDLFSRCGLVVLPYLDATQSALIAAAYFFGKPVIVTKTGALPEYVIDNETGWVIEPGNPQALADCLLTAFSDPERLAKMGEAGRAWYWTQRQLACQSLLNMYCQVTASAD